jgi:transcriptional regulator with XRE-family HTH domain
MDEQDISTNIRLLREAAGLTLTAVAQKADLTKSTLSKIETGQISPPIATLLRIARAMGVSLVDFFHEENPSPPYILTRKGKGQVVSRNGSQFGYSYEALCLSKRDNYAEPFLLTIRPGDPPGTFHHEGQEFIYVLSGQMECTIGGDRVVLDKGDSLYFDSHHVHSTQVIGTRPVQFLCVFIPTSNVRKGK